MRDEQISDALNLLDDSIIDEANRVRNRQDLSDKQAKWKIIVAVCACLGIIYILYFVIFDGVTRQELPMIQLSASFDVMGFEGVDWYDLSEMNNGNPWNEDMKLEKLPVYHNNSYHPAGMPTGLSEESMRENMETTVKELHMEVLTVTDAVSEEWMTDIEPGIVLSVIATAIDEKKVFKAEIVSEADGHLRIIFTPYREFPLENQDEEKVLDYLTQEFSELLGYDQPEKNVNKRYYLTGDYKNTFMVYDSSGDEINDILNYNFNYTTFNMDGDSSSLKIIHKQEGLSCAEKIGDYPIITAGKAKKLLLKGKYLEFPYELPGEEYIAGVELVYRTGRLEETFMPYYRFWVELPELQQDNGLKCHGAYYVPAVEEKYISNPIQ